MTDRTCLRCGSDRIIPDVPLSDAYGDWGELNQALKVKVHGNPDAWFFKDTVAGHLVAFICGACGHTELRTQGYLKLYRKYQESLGQGGASEELEPSGGEETEPAACLSCGQVMPARASRCGGCGWTWDTPERE